MLVVDPMKRMTIPEIRQHPWFQEKLPRYLAVPSPDTIQQAKKAWGHSIDEEILFQEAIFDRNQLVESLRSRIQNEATVAYYLMLDNWCRISNGYLGSEFQEAKGFVPTDRTTSTVVHRLHGFIDLGNLFVFDARLSVSPNVFKPMNATNKQRNVLCQGEIEGDHDYLAFFNSTFGRCHLCGSLLSEIRHRNCANLDCNRLILSCQECVQEFKGCCSTICTSAPRLRPVLYDAQPYERWHIYRDSRCSTQDVGQNNK
jgi:hypothetical protein